ncbi:MAG: DUF2243 domain-containing protein [Actinopolymorphaceae bacterium]
MRGILPAGVVLGVGVGGLLDGIVAHQLLAWHHLLSTWYPVAGQVNSRLNMIADGFFLLACLLIVVVGIGLLTRTTRTSMPDNRQLGGRNLAGSTVVGWGLFNVLEGLVDHQILGVHHVRPGPHELAYDVGFLAFGFLLIIVGSLVCTRRRDG